MTPNNYPEGLDELAKVILLKSGIGLYNTAKISGDELSSNFARALLDALAKRGYVLVDAKKQEPVGWVDDSGLVFWKDGAPPDGSHHAYIHREIEEQAQAGFRAMEARNG